MFFEKSLSIVTFLLVINIQRRAALLMHGNSNSTNMISAGQHFNLTEMATELRSLKQQVESDRSTIQHLQNRVFFLEAELKNQNASHDEYDKNTTKRLNDAVSSLENLKVQMRYTSHSLLDVHAKTEQLNTTLLKVFNNGILDVHSKTEQLNTTLLKVFNDGMLDVHDKSERLNTTLLKVFNDGMLDVHDKSERLNTTLLKVFNDGMLDVHTKTERLNTTLLKVFNDGMSDVHSKTEQLNTTLLRVFNDGMSGVSEQIANLTRNVAFTAGVSSSGSTWEIGTLVFDHVVYNIGGGYDPNTGVFTAPVDGHFVFFVNVQSYLSNSIFTYLVLNGTPKVTTMARSSSGAEYQAGPNLAVLRLQKGDRVWVNYRYGQGYFTYSVAPVTTFSGFLI